VKGGVWIINKDIALAYHGGSVRLTQEGWERDSERQRNKVVKNLNLGADSVSLYHGVAVALSGSL
jgi:hypothetical protein